MTIFELNEVVRFKSAEEHADPNNKNYMKFFGHICVVTDPDYEGDREGAVDDYYCVAVRSIGTGEEVICYAFRLEKFDG